MLFATFLHKFELVVIDQALLLRKINDIFYNQRITLNFERLPFEVFVCTVES